MPTYWLGDKVRVNDDHPEHSGLVGIIHAVDIGDDECDIFMLYTHDGESWFTEQQLEVVKEQSDDQR